MIILEFSSTSLLFLVLCEEPKKLQKYKISSVTVHALLAPVVRRSDRKKLVTSSAGRILRYRHRQNRYATAASVSARPQNCCSLLQKCSSFENPQKLKQLSDNDSASSTLSVSFRPMIRATLHVLCYSLLPLPCHRTDCLFPRLRGVVSTGEIIGDPTQTGARCSV